MEDKPAQLNGDGLLTTSGFVGYFVSLLMWFI
jgi:hypothetical protein